MAPIIPLPCIPCVPWLPPRNYLVLPIHVFSHEPPDEGHRGNGFAGEGKPRNTRNTRKGKKIQRSHWGRFLSVKGSPSSPCCHRRRDCACLCWAFDYGVEHGPQTSTRVPRCCLPSACARGFRRRFPELWRTGWRDGRLCRRSSEQRRTGPAVVRNRGG
jgi:hypothetical protein